MEGLVEFFFKLLPIIIAVLYFFGALKGRGKSQEAEEDDPEALERARKIQEEIRRKILERQQKSKPAQRSTPQQEAPAPSLREQQSDRGFRPEEPRGARETVPSPVAQEAPPIRLEYLEPEPQVANLYEEQRRKIDEELRKARELRQQVPNMPAISRASPVYSRDLTFALDRSIREDLRDPDSIRKAIVLKEILDTPVGLRQ